MVTFKISHYGFFFREFYEFAGMAELCIERISFLCFRDIRDNQQLTFRRVLPETFKTSFMKTIIITGANGNLGTATVKKFLDEGIYRVIAVDHSGTHLGFADAHHDLNCMPLN
jgi:FlaA1/EpsC-like NDP-sugar epimerase